MVKIKSGYCPELDKEFAISIDYSEIKMTGTLSNHYKKMGYCCNYESDNSCKVSKGNSCPIYLSAAKSL